MIDAHKIVYNNLSSEEFDVTLHLSFDSENGASNSFLNREAISTEVYDGSRKFIHGSKYTDSATPRFTLIKKDFGDFTSKENRRILSWLTGNSKPAWLDVYQDDSNVISYRYFCIPTTVEQYKLSNGRVVGYEFEIFSNAPYAWSRKLVYPEVYSTTEEISHNDETNDYLQVSGTESFSVTCNTDEYNKLIYPKVVIDFKNKSDIYIPVNKKPEADDYMIPNAIYTFEENSVQRQFISISAGNISERAYIMSVNVNADLNGLHEEAVRQNIRYFHVVDGRDHTIRTIEDGEWKIITKTGAAIKINISYTFNGETKTKEIIIKGAALDEEITLDGTNKVISVIPEDGVRIMGDDFNWEWLPLAYGDNNITISGNCAVQIQWIEPRKVGSL